MTLNITLALDNAAFDEAGTQEVRRILNKLCDRLGESLEPTGGDLPLIDHNGNRVGHATIS